MYNQHYIPQMTPSAYYYTAICGVVVCVHGSVWQLQDTQWHVQ